MNGDAGVWQSCKQIFVCCVVTDCQLEIERPNRLFHGSECGTLGNALLTDFNDCGAFNHFDGLVRE